MNGGKRNLTRKHFRLSERNMEHFKKKEIISDESKQKLRKDPTVEGTSGFPGPQNCVVTAFKEH